MAIEEVFPTVTSGKGKPPHAGPVQFDPKRHLNYSPPSKTLSMRDIGLVPTEVSPVAHTFPFSFMSHEAIVEHRREIFSEEALDACLNRTRPASVQIRGAAPRYAPFVHQFWTSPEVLKIVSDLAGIELVPVVDYEIAHTNAQLDEEGVRGVYKTPVEPPLVGPEAAAKYKKEASEPKAVTDEVTPIVEWHFDSHPFVVVVMLSDATHMVGGETEIMGGDGKTFKVKAPQMGCATLLQGRYVKHIALTALNMPERITVVTSFRPKNPLILDESTNMNTRIESNTAELYYQWTTYRLEVLAQRAQIAADELRARYKQNVLATDPEGKPGMCVKDTVDHMEMVAWVGEQKKYMDATVHEIRPIDKDDDWKQDSRATSPSPDGHLL